MRLTRHRSARALISLSSLLAFAACQKGAPEIVSSAESAPKASASGSAPRVGPKASAPIASASVPMPQLPAPTATLHAVKADGAAVVIGARPLAVGDARDLAWTATLKAFVLSLEHGGPTTPVYEQLEIEDKIAFHDAILALDGTSTATVGKREVRFTRHREASTREHAPNPELISYVEGKSYVTSGARDPVAVTRKDATAIEPREVDRVQSVVGAREPVLGFSGPIEIGGTHAELEALGLWLNARIGATFDGAAASATKITLKGAQIDAPMAVFTVQTTVSLQRRGEKVHAILPLTGELRARLSDGAIVDLTLTGVSHAIGGVRGRGAMASDETTLVVSLVVTSTP